MITVASAVEDLITGDDLALESLRSGHLNLSAYAQQIHAQVEAQTQKPVRVNTISVALSRLSPKLTKADPLKPTISINSLSVASPLVAITYERTRNHYQQALSFLATHQQDKSFSAVTGGNREITIILPDPFAQELKNQLKNPKAYMEKLVAVTVTFSSVYLQIPNALYTLLYSLAQKRLNLIEIVSTYTEITFVVEDHNLDPTIKALKPFLR